MFLRGDPAQAYAFVGTFLAALLLMVVVGPRRLGRDRCGAVVGVGVGGRAQARRLSYWGAAGAVGAGALGSLPLFASYHLRVVATAAARLAARSLTPSLSNFSA